MCHANENCKGAEDSDALTNTAVMNSINEAVGHAIDHGWPTALSEVLFDTDADGFAQADANKNGDVTVAEWFDAAQGEYARTAILCSNLEGAADRPPFTNINNEKNPPGPAGGGGKQGFEGHGVCSQHDFGDAPDNGMVCPGPSGSQPRYYYTSLSNDGPRYNEWVLQWLGPIEGEGPATDGEPDGDPTCGANSDGGDEDGVAFADSSVTVTVSVDYPEPLNYRLDAWWDLDDDGTFDPATEHIIESLTDYDGSTGGRLIDLAGSPQSYEFEYSLPFNPVEYYSRFRLTFGVPDVVTITPSGEFVSEDDASHGEVEDYPPVSTHTPEIEWSWGTIKSIYR